jgi:hypothetical protein
LPAGLWVLTPNSSATRAPRIASGRRAVTRGDLHRPRAPSIGKPLFFACFRDAPPSALADICNLCNLRAQPQIT